MSTPCPTCGTYVSAALSASKVQNEILPIGMVQTYLQESDRGERQYIWLKSAFYIMSMQKKIIDITNYTMYRYLGWEYNIPLLLLPIHCHRKARVYLTDTWSLLSSGTPNVSSKHCYVLKCLLLYQSSIYETYFKSHSLWVVCVRIYPV